MSNSSFKNGLKHLSCICHTHVMFMHMLTQNQPLHRVQCRAVLVSNRKCVWWTLTLRLCVADLWRFFYTSVPLTQNFVHNQVLHVKVFNSWNANRTLFIFYFISLFKCVFPWIVARRPNLPQKCFDSAPITSFLFILICLIYPYLENHWETNYFSFNWIKD